MSVSGHIDYARRRSARRTAARARIHVHVLHPIDTPTLLPDPLAHATSRLRGTFATLKLLVVAVLLHVLLIAVLYAVSELVGDLGGVPQRDVVAVRVVDVPRVAEPEPEPEAPAAPVTPDFGVRPAPQSAPELPPPPAAKKPRTPKRPKKVTEAPPPPAAPAAQPAPPQRYRAGISLESTVKGGSGPAMATGTSRMGTTSTTAKAPQAARPSPRGTSDKPGGKPTARPVRQQRAAANIPTRRSVFAKPKRVKPSKAPYPTTLKAQGIEGDVKVRVSLDASGRVQDVTVLISSGHSAFDDAARKAARAERFRPATRDDKPVPYTLSYSYRFRIEEE